MSSGEAGVGRSWPHVRVGIGGPAKTPLAEVGGDDWGELNRLQAQARKDEKMIELQRQEIQALRVEREKLEKELASLDATLVRVMDDKALAEHRAFKAEVEMRRAQQKRRNQKLELKRLHRAISDKNNRIRNLESENRSLHEMIEDQAKLVSSLMYGPEVQ